MTSEALPLWFGSSETQRGGFEFIESKQYDRTFSNKFVVLGEADECIVFIDLLSANNCNRSVRSQCAMFQRNALGATSQRPCLKILAQMGLGMERLQWMVSGVSGLTVKMLFPSR